MKSIQMAFEVIKIYEVQQIADSMSFDAARTVISLRWTLVCLSTLNAQ